MQTELLSFGQRNFGQLDLGDRRRTQRLVRSVDQMVQQPAGTLPHKINDPASLRAFYRLMDRPELTHAVVLDGHAQQTRQAITTAGVAVVLILHDATELDFTAKTTVAEHLSQIGQGTHRGYICHNSLAVRADSGAILGLTSQILHSRADVSADETLRQKRQRSNRESRLWLQGAQASGTAPEGVCCVDVSDSLSDTFEYMAFEVAEQRHFVLRQREDRRLQTAIAGACYLEEAVRAVPAVAERPLKVLASPGRTARDTTVQVAFTPIRLAPPGKRHGEYTAEPLDLWAVRVWEPNTPAGEEPLEWILLTNVPVDDADAALERIDWYERRPIIEEYHKAMKTGCAIESLQFQTTGRLEPAVAVLSVLATTLLQLRDAARAPDGDERLATEFIGEDYVIVLRNYYGRRLGPQPSLRAFLMHVARLGGHQNRKRDGFPGWITLWRGWIRLQAMVIGYHTRLRSNQESCGTN